MTTLTLDIPQIWLGPQKLNRSRDPHHTPSRSGLSSVGFDLLWSSYLLNMKFLSPLILKTEKEMQNIENGVVWGYLGII